MLWIGPSQSQRISGEKTGPRDTGMVSLISGAEVAEVVKKLLNGRDLGVGQIDFATTCGHRGRCRWGGDPSSKEGKPEGAFQL